MKGQILFVMLVALVSISCCKGAESDNIFRVRYESRIKLSELEEYLSMTHYEMDKKTIASFLAQAWPKDERFWPIGYLSVDDLLELAEIDTKNPVEACERSQFLDKIKMCDRFYQGGNAIKQHLFEYCSHCNEKRFQFCASRIDKNNELTERRALFGDKILELFNRYSAKIGTKEEDIAKFWHANLELAGQFNKLCSVLDDLLREDLLFFDKDRKKTLAYLAQDKEAALVKKRCDIFAGELWKKGEGHDKELAAILAKRGKFGKFGKLGW